MLSRRLLERWLLLSALGVMAATALAYPMCLRADWFLALQQRFFERGEASAAFFETMLRAPLQFGYSPLILKETLGASFVVFLLIGYAPWKLLYASAPSRERGGLHAPLLALLLLGGVSILWSPAPRMTARTLENFAAGVVFFLIVSDMRWGEAGRRKALWAIAAVGAVICAVAVCQMLPGVSDAYHAIFYRFDDPRNSVGSWIGHNTEMSGFALSTLLAAMALYATSRNRAARWLLAAILLGAAAAIVRGQSRSFWPLTLLLGGGGALAIARVLGRTVRARHALLAVAAALALCLPFAPQLRQRLRDYGLEAIRKETRLRIAVVSQSLLREKPWLGHGLGSFASVYPKAQGDYFEAHPDSILDQTVNRTQRAHNDYLQLAIELGLAGLALGLGALALYGWAGWRGWKALRSPSDRAQSLAFGLIAAAHALNALVNFPAHVAPAAYLFALALGLWTALAREARAEEAAAPQTAADAHRPRSSGASRTALAAASLIPLLAAPFLWSHFAKILAVSTHLQIGQGFAARLLQSPPLPPEQRDWHIQQAGYHLDRAWRMDLLNWEVLFNLAQVYFVEGHAYALAYAQSAQAPGAEQEAQRLREAAYFYLNRAADRLEDSFKELAFHQSLYVMAKTQLALESVDPQGGHAELAHRYLQEAARYSGVYFEALAGLWRFRERPDQPPSGAEFWAKLGRQMIAANPRRYESEIVAPLRGLIMRYDCLEAAEGLRRAIAVEPGRADLWGDLVLCYVEAGRLDQAEAELSEMRSRVGECDEWRMALSRLRMARGEFEDALRALHDPKPGYRWKSHWRDMAASLLCEKLGQPEEARRLWKQAMESGGGENQPWLLHEAAWIAGKHLGLKDRARELADAYRGRFWRLAPLMVHLSASLWADQGEYDRALEELDEFEAHLQGVKEIEALRQRIMERAGKPPSPASAP